MSLSKEDRDELEKLRQTVLKTCEVLRMIHKDVLSDELAIRAGVAMGITMRYAEQLNEKPSNQGQTKEQDR